MPESESIQSDSNVDYEVAPSFLAGQVEPARRGLARRQLGKDFALLGGTALGLAALARMTGTWDVAGGFLGRFLDSRAAGSKRDELTRRFGVKIDENGEGSDPKTLALLEQCLSVLPPTITRNLLITWETQNGKKTPPPYTVQLGGVLNTRFRTEGLRIFTGDSVYANLGRIPIPQAPQVPEGQVRIESWSARFLTSLKGKTIRADAVIPQDATYEETVKLLYDQSSVGYLLADETPQTGPFIIPSIIGRSLVQALTSDINTSHGEKQVVSSYLAELAQWYSWGQPIFEQIIARFTSLAYARTVYEFLRDDLFKDSGRSIEYTAPFQIKPPDQQTNSTTGQ